MCNVISILCDVISFSVICKPRTGGARGSCGTGVCIVVLELCIVVLELCIAVLELCIVVVELCIAVLGLDVLSNGFLCTGYLCASSCVLFALCCVLLKCAYCCVHFRCRTAG